MKDRDELEKYNNPTLFQFFPATDTRVLLIGKPRYDWLEKLMFSGGYSAFWQNLRHFETLFFLSLVRRSEYWDAIAIMEYKDRASFCRMVSLNSLHFPVSLVISSFSFASSLAGSQQ